MAHLIHGADRAGVWSEQSWWFKLTKNAKLTTKAHDSSVHLTLYRCVSLETMTHDRWHDVLYATTAAMMSFLDA